MNSFILSLDLGNTHEKACLFNNELKSLEVFSLKELKLIIQKYQLSKLNTRAGVCSVKSQFDFSQIPFNCFVVGDYFEQSSQGNFFLKMPVNYGTTLGLDRLIQSWYLYQISKNKKLIIDTGTFTTADFIDEDGLQGGFILPGLGTILKSYSQGENLTRFQVKEDLLFNKNFNSLASTYPHSTQEAIEAGALITFVAPILQIIQENPGYDLTVTGGNGELLTKYLQRNQQNKLQLFASIHFERNLIHKAIGTFVQTLSVQAEEK